MVWFRKILHLLLMNQSPVPLLLINPALNPNRNLNRKSHKSRGGCQLGTPLSSFFPRPFPSSVITHVPALERGLHSYKDNKNPWILD